MRVIDVPKLSRVCNQICSQRHVGPFFTCRNTVINVINETGEFMTAVRAVPAVDTPMSAKGLGRLERGRPARLGKKVMRLSHKMDEMASPDDLEKEMKIIDDIDRNIKFVIYQLNEVMDNLEAVGKKLTPTMNSQKLGRIWRQSTDVGVQTQSLIKEVEVLMSCAKLK